MMQSSFLSICILLVLVQTTLVSSHKELGYDCDNVFIPRSKLKEVVKEARAASHYLGPSIGELYGGPPFRKTYLLWPVSIGTEHYSEATKTPYRVVLDVDFKVFSVIMKISPESFIKECRYRENLSSLNSYKCGDTVYLPDKLGRAALYACNKITEIASLWSPIRYDGPAYEGSGKQLYITPVVTHLDRPNSIYYTKSQKMPWLFLIPSVPLLELSL